MIEVKYNDNRQELVKPWDLEELIATDKIRAFQRATGWVDVGRDRIRGVGGNYNGFERRYSYEKHQTHKPTYYELSQQVRSLEKEITQLKAHETVPVSALEGKADLKKFLKAAPVGIGLLQNQVLCWVSDRVCNMLGYCGDDLIGEDFRTLYESNEECQRVKQKLCCETGLSGPSEVETRWKRKDGAMMDVSLQVVPADNINFPTRVLFTAVDISERKRKEEESLKDRKLESLGILAGGIAHDFNNLLTGIIGNVSLAKVYVNQENKAFALLEETLKDSSRAKGLTQQLLTFAKGGSPITKSVSVRKFIEESAGYMFQESGTRCELSLPDDLWPVEIDEGQICQVVRNLVKNAHESMPKGSRVSIRAEKSIIVDTAGLQPVKKKYVKISIQDRGEGIPQEYIAKIFDPYFSLKEKGNGLGLAICYSIIKKHHGFITVDSKPGNGTIFHVFLPASVKNESNNQQEGPGPDLEQ